MGRSRTQQLLDLLTEEEIVGIKKEIVGSGRESLGRLLAELRKHNGDEDDLKDELFQGTFGKRWSKKDDYLLRNELRLLNDHLYRFIAGKENNENLERERGRRERMLLQGLLSRRGYGTFESLYKRFYEEALERMDYHTALHLNKIWFDYLIRHQELTLGAMHRAHESLMESLGHIKRIYRNDTSENQHRRVVVEQNLLGMGEGIATTEIGTDMDIADVETPFAQFYDAISLAYASQGEKKIEYARLGVEVIFPVRRHFPERMMFGYAILASLLYTSHRYGEARQVFEDGLAFTREASIEPSAEMLFNYSGTLMRLKEYNEVLNLLDEYHTTFDSYPKLRFRVECFRCFCHIFLNDSARAYQAVPPDIQQRPESEHNYFRFIYLILPYMNDDPESALREARDFLVYFNRNKEKLHFPQEKRVATLYRAFYATIYNETDKEKQRKELRQILGKIEQFVEEESEYRDYLYVSWLSMEVDKWLRGDVT